MWLIDSDNETNESITQTFDGTYAEVVIRRRYKVDRIQNLRDAVAGLIDVLRTQVVPAASTTRLEELLVQADLLLSAPRDSDNPDTGSPPGPQPREQFLPNLRRSK